MRRRLRTRPAPRALIAACVAAGLALPTAALGLSFRTSAVRGALAQLHPGMSLPTRLPPRIAWAEVGGGCRTLGPGVPHCFVRLEYTTRRTGGTSAFQLAIFAGHVRGKVLSALSAHDGRFGSTSPFRARSFSGIRERQWDKARRIGGVDTYVWESGANTYLLQHPFRQNGAPVYAGLVPRAVIGSFTSVGTGAPSTAGGPGATLIAMPNVIGQTPDAAAGALQQAGLSIGLSMGARAPTPDLVGKVVQTTPAAGDIVAPGAIVTLAIGA